MSSPRYPRRRGSIRALPCLVLALALAAGPAIASPLVALIDSGLDHTHPDLAGRIVAGHDFVDEDPVADDRLGHGTGMAGIIAGAGGGCRIMPLKVAGPAGAGGTGRVTASRLARAIVHAIEHHADLIFIGAGFEEPDEAVARAIARAEAEGIPVIAPAGGRGPLRMLYPAAFPTVIPVAMAEDRARPLAALAVSGADVRTSALGGGSVVRDGSSVAAARVAAFVARRLEDDPGLRPARLRRLLRPAGTPSALAAAPTPPKGLRSEADGVLLYADRAGTDVVIDAPWRTVRDYVPVLFYFPQFRGGRRVERIRVLEWVDGAPAGTPIVVDRVAGPDTLNGATFIGPMGESRGGLGPEDRVGDFWHYIVRIPLSALGARATPGPRYLRAEVEWTRPGLLGRQRLTTSRVLRVQVGPAQFPSLDPADRYLDTHVHSIAEQTSAAVLDVDGAHKAYCGPVVMLLEASYALGLVQTQPRDGNWDAYRDSVVVTDHNVFYSTRPFDAGARPGAGPTAAVTDGHVAEAAWYRDHLGRLAGEEITLRRGSNQDGSVAPNLGHHLLAYGTRHFEGPWHGGMFVTSRLENPNTLEAVLAGTRSAGAEGFLYAAHPELDGFVWPPEYHAQAIGYAPHDSRTGPQVDSAGTDFVFKGYEVWNIKADEVARGSGHLPASSAFEEMNPFAGGPGAQRFLPAVWDGELARSLDTLYAHIGRGLRFAFREAPKEAFIRKLYLSAGSDAHGDFNYTDEVTATLMPYSGMLTSNAYACVRTYALVHERAPGAWSALDAFRDGNTVVTDGPLVTFSVDADGRHDPAAGAARWHDAESRWRDADGRIGGSGRFDGGGTVLVPLPGDGVWIRSRWERSATPGAGEIARFRFDRVAASTRDSFALAAGAAATPDERPSPVAMDRLAALVATARDPGVGERCITNPVWVAPVGIEVVRPPAGEGFPPPLALPPRGLRVVFEFPISMAPSAATRAFLRPLDSLGVSTDPEIELVPDPGWEERDGMTGARYSATNPDSVPLPLHDWDAGSHARVPGSRSFVVYLTRPADVHGNVLNDVGRAFAVPTSSPPRVPEGGSPPVRER